MHKLLSIFIHFNYEQNTITYNFHMIYDEVIFKLLRGESNDILGFKPKISQFNDKPFKCDINNDKFLIENKALFKKYLKPQNTIILQYDTHTSIKYASRYIRYIEVDGYSTLTYEIDRLKNG